MIIPDPKKGEACKRDSTKARYFDPKVVHKLLD